MEKHIVESYEADYDTPAEACAEATKIAVGGLIEKNLTRAAIELESPDGVFKIEISRRHPKREIN